MIVTHNTNMDLIKRGVSPTIYAAQGDILTRKLVVTLFENGEPWPVPSGVTAGMGQSVRYRH